MSNDAASRKLDVPNIGFDFKPRALFGSRKARVVHAPKRRMTSHERRPLWRELMKRGHVEVKPTSSKFHHLSSHVFSPIHRPSLRILLDSHTQDGLPQTLQQTPPKNTLTLFHPSYQEKLVP